MFEIVAQSVQDRPRSRFEHEVRTLWFTVVDNDGETVFKTLGDATLAMMEATGTMHCDAYARSEAFRKCVDFCGEAGFDLSPCFADELRKHSSYTLEMMLR